MTGLLYKILRTNLVKILLFILAMLFYPVFTVCAAYVLDYDDTFTPETSIMIFVFGAFMAFLMGGACQDSVFNDDERKKWAYFITSTPTGVKGQIGAKYLFTLCFSMLTVTVLILLNGLAMDGNKNVADASVVYLIFFCLQLAIRSIEFPLMSRFGGQMGKNIKIVLVGVIVFVAFVYALYGDTSVFNDLGDFWDKLFKFAEDPQKMKKAMLWFSIIAAAVLPLYYLSYRLSVKWYLKGAENYAK